MNHRLESQTQSFVIIKSNSRLIIKIITFLFSKIVSGIQTKISISTKPWTTDWNHRHKVVWLLKVIHIWLLN